MAVYLTDARQLDPLVPVFRESFGRKLSSKDTVTVSNLAVTGMMLEITAIAVTDDK